VLSIVLASPGGPARAADLAAPEVGDLARVDFARSDTEFRPLFPDLEEDREKIKRLLELYRQALAALGPESTLAQELGENQPALWFLNRVRLTLRDGGCITLILYQGVIICPEDGGRCYRVTDPQVSRELEELALSYFVPAQGVRVSASQLRMGQPVTVSSDVARAKEAHILIMPSYSPMTIPSAPYPYPVPEAILIATVPVERDRFTYTFTLTETLGTKLDGSPGRLGPGAWLLVVQSGSQTMVPVSILPEEAWEPRAVGYCRGRVFVWTAGEGLNEGRRSSPADQPLLIGEARWGSPVTHVSPGFLRDWLGVAVTELAPGRWRLGRAELNLTVALGDDKARVNGTMLDLGGTVRQTAGTARLPWTELGRFFGYRVQWRGPETAVFLRGLDRVPPELERALAAAQVGVGRRGRAVTLTLDGKKLDLGNHQAYLDPGQGRVMVPLRATVAALGGRVEWFAVRPGYREADAAASGGLAPYGEEVTAWVDVSRGGNVWRVYLTPAEGGSTVMVPLRELAAALGFDLLWEAPRATTDLRPAR